MSAYQPCLFTQRDFLAACHPRLCQTGEHAVCPRPNDQHPRPPSPKPRWHPNVYQDGNLCLDLLQDAWSPIQTVSTLLTSIQSLFSDPNCASPANPEAAHQYLSDRVAYNRRVRRLAEKTLE